MISFFTSLCFQLFLSRVDSFRKNIQTFINRLSFSKTLLHLKLGRGKPRCDKSALPEFEKRTLEVEKKENFLFYFVTDGACSSRLCPPGGSVAPGEKLLPEVTFVFLPVSPPLSLKKHRSIKKGRGGENTVPGLK